MGEARDAATEGGWGRMDATRARRHRTPGRGFIRFGILLVVLAFALPNALGAGNGHGGQGACKKRTCTTSDTIAPADAIVDPVGGTQVSKTITVTGSATDNVAVASVQVALDAGAFKAASGTTSWTYSLDTSAYANGEHTVTSRATDTSGNVGIATIAIDVENTAAADTTAPSVAIAAPASGSTVSGTITVSGSASDAGGLASVVVSIDGGAFTAATGTASWSYALQTTSLSNASHTITARATDAAGNTRTASVTITVANVTAPPPPNSSPTHMVTPEGVTIDVNSAGPWTAQQIYDLLKPSALQLNLVGPHLTIKVQDTYSSQTATSASTSGGVYTSYSAIVYLKGVNSTFATQPDSTIAHEYGHAWTLYHLYIDHNGVWSSYLQARWSMADGSMTLATDPRLDSSYNWMRSEIIADDYRLLFGDALAISQRPVHLNAYIPQPKDVTGLRSFLLNSWGTPG